MEEEGLEKYLNLSDEDIRQQLLHVLSRQVVPRGVRQESFLPVETLLTYGLFFVMNPHRYGGGNISTIPDEAAKLAILFRRTPGSINSKLLNLYGSLANSAKYEPKLFAYLGKYPTTYATLYHRIFLIARELSIAEDRLPDFLGLLSPDANSTGQIVKPGLLGQEELPYSTTELLAGPDKAEELEFVEKTFELDEILTEKLVEQKVRLAQHRFAREVLQNCGYICVFCGFTPPPALPQSGSGLLRASHIKPWSVSNNQERIDVKNGLAACPIHDAAFDRGYLTVNTGYEIERSKILEQGISINQATERYFGDGILGQVLLLPSTALKPKLNYLKYHRHHIYRE